MTVQGTAGAPSKGKTTGTRKWSVVTETIDSGDTITVDGDVIGGAVFARTDSAGIFASVTGVSGDTVTVETVVASDGSSSTGDDVTVVALTE